MPIKDQRVNGEMGAKEINLIDSGGPRLGVFSVEETLSHLIARIIRSMIGEICVQF